MLELLLSTSEGPSCFREAEAAEKVVDSSTEEEEEEEEEVVKEEVVEELEGVGS